MKCPWWDKEDKSIPRDKEEERAMLIGIGKGGIKDGSGEEGRKDESGIGGVGVGLIGGFVWWMVVMRGCAMVGSKG